MTTAAHDSRAALEQLCALLAPGDGALAEEVLLARDQPAAYAARFASRLEERGADADSPALAWIALCDALAARGRCRNIDWKSEARDVAWSVEQLVAALPGEGARWPERWSWVGEERYGAMRTDALLHVAGAFLVPRGVALASLDPTEDWDSYELVLIPRERVDAAKALAAASTLGSVRTWIDGRAPQPAAAEPAAPQGRRVSPPGERTFELAPAGVQRVWIERERTDLCNLRGLLGPDERVSALTRGADGRWLLVTRAWKEGGPFTEADRRLSIFDASFGREERLSVEGRVRGFEWVGFHQGRVVALPGLYHDDLRPYVQGQDGVLRPQSHLPDKPGNHLSALIPLGDGGLFVVWQQRIWELKGEALAPAFAFEAGRDVRWTETAPAGRDGFHVLRDGAVAELHRGGEWIAHELKLSCMGLAAGPDGALVLQPREKLHGAIYFPAEGTFLKLEKKLLGTRDPWRFAWAHAPDALVVADDTLTGDKVLTFSASEILALPRLDARTGRARKKSR